MTYNWQDLTPTTITNLFLYGTETPPTDLISNALIRPPETKTTIKVDAVSFMTSGPGRFANAALSPVVGAFFDSVLPVFQETGVRREYSRDAMASLLGSEAKFSITVTVY